MAKHWYLQNYLKCSIRYIGSGASWSLCCSLLPIGQGLKRVYSKAFPNPNGSCWFLTYMIIFQCQYLWGSLLRPRGELNTYTTFPPKTSSASRVISFFTNLAQGEERNIPPCLLTGTFFLLCSVSTSSQGEIHRYKETIPLLMTLQAQIRVCKINDYSIYKWMMGFLSLFAIKEK